MITTQFTDAQGVTFEAAILLIKEANLNKSSNESLYTDYSDRQDVSYNTNTNGNSYINYSVVYWANSELYDGGFTPYTLTGINDGADGINSFHFEVTEEYEGLSLLEACELHLQDTLLKQ